MTAAIDLHPIQSFLAVATPRAWVEAASRPANLPLLLTDHANCEKKAASTAMHLLYRYVDRWSLLHRLSRLAREELRHFEQVIALMEKRGIRYAQITASRYAGALREACRSDEPGRLVDTLIVGAIIEARSCERFALLAPHLDEELGAFYRSLLKSEARHFMDYLSLAEEVAGNKNVVQARAGELLAVEAGLIQSVDVELRFHSGPPAPA